jgi:hypothetical protein
MLRDEIHLRDETHLFVGKKLGLEEANIPDFTTIAGQTVLFNWMKEDYPDFEFDLQSSIISDMRKLLDTAYGFLLKAR